MSCTRCMLPCAGAVVALALGLVAPSHADVTVESHTFWPDLFDYKLVHMPDLDQKRLTMPGGGYTYCSPTAAVNLLAYAGNHGFPNLEPGGGNWQAQAKYGEAFDAIFEMGELMNTDPEDGTCCGNSLEGLKDWPGLTDKFIVRGVYTDGADTPRLEDLALDAFNGCIVYFCFGRYEVTGSDDGVPEVDRVSGHCVSLVGARKFLDGTKSVELHNPADAPNGDDHALTQSLFWRKTPTITDVNVKYSGDFRWYSGLNYEPGDDLFRLIDSYYKIKPKSGYGWDDIGITVLNPFLGEFFLGDEFTCHSMEEHQAPVLDVVDNPDLTGYVVLLDAADGEPAKVLTVDSLTGAQTHLHDILDPRAITIGRNRDLYVLEGGLLNRYDADGNYQFHSHAPASPTALSLAFDDSRDEVVGIGLAQNSMYRWPADLLGAQPVRLILPDGVELSEDGLHMSIGPDSDIFVMSAGSGIYHLVQVGNDELELVPFVIEGLSPTLKSVSADDRGHLFVTRTGGIVLELMPTGPGTWAFVSTPFSEEPVGDRFRMARSNSNFDPATMTYLDDNTVPDDPEEWDWPGGPECSADLTLDDVVGVDDLVEVILRWGSDDPFADIAPEGGDLVVGVDDLVEVILQWGPC